MKSVFKSGEEVKIERIVDGNVVGYIELKGPKLYCSNDGFVTVVQNVDEFIVNWRALDSMMFQASFKAKNHVGEMQIPFRFNGLLGQHIKMTHNGQEADLNEEVTEVAGKKQSVKASAGKALG